MSPLTIELQIGKAEKVASAWGIHPRRLKHLMDEGLIKYRHRGAGRGSMRFLTDESLLDIYLVSHLSHDLTPSQVRSCIRAARRHYSDWLRPGWFRGAHPVWVVFKIDHAPLHTTQVRLSLEPAVTSILTVREHLKDRPRINRGRPQRDWRDEFEEDMAEIGRALRASAASRPALEDDIRAYRARRQATAEEVHVTVQA